MSNQPDPADVIELLACDIAERPSAAPTANVLAPHVRSVDRSSTALIIRFAPEAADDLEAFAAAERICCAGIGWDVKRDPVVLTITASAAQLDAIEQIFPAA